MEQNNNTTGELSLKWTPGDIKCLIDLYENNIERFDALPKKKVWEDVAADMRSIRKKNFTAEQCNGKWKGLKTMYKKVKDHNNTSGNSRKAWEYFDDLDKILFRRPEIIPPASCSSDDSVVNVRPDLQQRDYDFDDVIEDTSSSASYAEARVASTSRKRKTEDPEAAARAKRHNKKMDQNNRFLDIFERLVDKITKD